MSPGVTSSGTGRTIQSLPSTNARPSGTKRLPRIEIVAVTWLCAGSMRVTDSVPVSSTQIAPAPVARLRTSLVPATGIVAVTRPVAGSMRATRFGCETQIEPNAEIMAVAGPANVVGCPTCTVGTVCAGPTTLTADGLF